MRTKGAVLFDDTLVSNPVVDEAKKRQRQKQEESRFRAAERRERPVPNYICYAAAFPNFDPVTHTGAPCPLPKCRVCRDGVLHPMEHHNCPGFTPMFVEHDDAWKERMEARREAKRNGTFFSDDEDEPEEDEPEEDWCDEDDGDPMWE
jgi:hypothetical protein